MFRSVLAAGGLAALAALLWCVARDSAGKSPSPPDLPSPSCKPDGVIRFQVDSLRVLRDSIRVSTQITPTLDLEDVTVRLARGLDEIDVLSVSSMARGVPLQVSASTTLPGLQSDRMELRVYASLEGTREHTIAVQPLTDPEPDLRASPNGSPLPEIRDQGGHSIDVPAEHRGGQQR